MFSARRKPKRITHDGQDRNSNDEEESGNGPVVRRPNAAPKSKSKLRTSFAPDEADDSSDATAVVVKPKPKLGQTASSQSLPRFNIDNRTQEDAVQRPSYSKSALEELRNSTPSTPKDLSVYDPSSSGAEEGIRDLDLASKFGPNPTSSSFSSGTIPSAAEIAERKSRRARLAQEQAAAPKDGEQDYISLDDNTLYDSDGEFKPSRMQVGTYLRADAIGERDTRLVRDDEDMLEGFDEYTEDAESKRLTMGPTQLVQARRRDRDAMREMIEHAEGGRRQRQQQTGSGNLDLESDSDSDSDSEIERNHAYETAQTSHGMDGLAAAKAAHRKAGADRPRPPREVTPVPKLSAVLGRLKERIARVEIERVRLDRRREEVRTARAEIVASQEHIQRSLIEAGEELERVQRRQADEEGQAVDGGGVNGALSTTGTTGTTGVVGRGLDNMGLMTEPT